MYIIIAILAFGILIAVHEFGHFITAKLCGVKVNEFAIGMGPAILKKQRGETLYALRILPLGGYCAMEGEDTESDDPRSFTSQTLPKKLLILFAGAFMNFVLGLIIVLIIFSGLKSVAGNTIHSFAEGFPLEGESGLMAGDEIIKIDGHRIFYIDDFRTYMSRSNGKTVDMVIVRDGEKIKLNDFPLTLREYADNEGKTSLRYGISFGYEQTSFFDNIRYGFYEAYNFVRTVWLGLSDLVTGAVGVKDMSGVVGIVDIISETGENSPTKTAAAINISYLCAFIAVNLAVMNLLPIPALDGGRIFLLIVTWVIEKIIRRRIDPKYEGYIHTAGMSLLLALMLFLIVNDVLRIVNG